MAVASSRPSSEQFRAPTIATARSRGGSGRPLTKRAAGGSSRFSSCGGYSARSERHEARAACDERAVDGVGVELPCELAIRVAAGPSPTDRLEGGHRRSLSVGHLQQLERRDAAQRHQDEQRLSIRLTVGEARRPPRWTVPRTPPAGRSVDLRGRPHRQPARARLPSDRFIRYVSASAMCPAAISSAPARSATVLRDLDGSIESPAGEAQGVDSAGQNVVPAGGHPGLSPGHRPGKLGIAREPERRIPVPLAGPGLPTRARIGEDASPAVSPRSSRLDRRGTTRRMSMRSRSGPDSFWRYSSTRCGGHRHWRLGSPS